MSQWISSLVEPAAEQALDERIKMINAQNEAFKKRLAVIEEDKKKYGGLW